MGIISAITKWYVCAHTAKAFIINTYGERHTLYTKAFIINTYKDYYFINVI